MDNTEGQPLTAKQQYWYEHLKLASTANCSLADYAKQEQLDVKLLYHYKSILRHNGQLSTSSFVKVTQSSVLRHESFDDDRVSIHLPNDIRIDLPYSLVDLRCLLHSVSAL